MRDFFINSLDVMAGIIVVLLGVVTLILAALAFREDGLVFGLVMLGLGVLYTVMMGGIMYLFLGIYQNTKKTASLMEQMLDQEL